MSQHAVKAPGKGRANLYDEITDKIIAELEAGRVPWVQPWGTSAAKAPIAMPKNAATQRRYSGVNVLILWGAVIGRGFAGQSWLTFRQALSLGGNVRKGERGSHEACSQWPGDTCQNIPWRNHRTMQSPDHQWNEP